MFRQWRPVLQFLHSAEIIRAKYHEVNMSKKSKKPFIDAGRIDDAQHEVRQNPLRAVGITLGIGFGVGALIGLLALRRSSNS